VDGGSHGPVDGFFIYYAPFDRDDSLYDKHVVHGSTVRHAVLSRLSAATPYSIRMTSFGTAGPDSVGGESDFSNSVVKATLGESTACDLTAAEQSVLRDARAPERSDER